MKNGDKFLIHFEVNKSVYEGFAKIFKDKNPLHIDKSFAQEHGFSSVVMHGNILGGFLSFFIGECLPFKDIMIISQNINYKNPVYLNDKLALKSEIIHYFESTGLFEFKYHFENQSGFKVANGKILIKRL